MSESADSCWKLTFLITGLALVSVLVSVTATIIAPQVVHWVTGSSDSESRTGVSDDLVQSVAKLRDDSGLFQLPEAGQRNSIETRIYATYLSSRLLGLRFHEVASVTTEQALYNYARDAIDRHALQLEAYAALKALGDPRWEGGIALAKKYMAGVADPVTQNSLPQYLALAEPAVQLVPDLKVHRLQEFDPGADENAQRSAGAAVALSYLFSNRSAVVMMFPELQRKMRIWAGEAVPPITKFLISSIVMQVSGLYSEPSTMHEKRAFHLKELRGCAGSDVFLSIDGTDDARCSLTLTRMAQAVAG